MQVCPVCRNQSKTLARILHYARPYKLRMAAVGLLLVLTTAVELIPPDLEKMAIDLVLEQAETMAETEQFN